MLTKQKNVIKAYNALLKIYDRVIDGYISLPLFRLKKALTAQYQFQQAQEQKLTMKYGEGINKDRTVRFKSEADKDEFFQALGEMAEMDVEVEWKRISLVVDEVPFSVKELDALDGFIEFQLRGDRK